MYVYPQNIQKDTSTNIKTSLNTAALAFDSIKNLGTDLNPATLAAYNTQLSGLTATQQKMALSTTNLTLAQQKQVLSYIAETAAAKSLTAQQIAELSIDQKQALIKAGLITQEQIETGVTLELSKAQLQKIITSDAISIKDKELILGAFGVTGANLTETSSWEVLGASIKKATAAMLKWLFLTPAGWATLAITAIAGTIVAYNKWGDTLENNRKKLEELKSEAQTISSDLQTFNSELQTTQQRISELESKGNLTFTEAEELENLRKQNNELQRSIDLLRLKEKENNKGKNKTFVKTMQKNVDVEDERVQTGRLNPDDTAETEMITEAELIERKFNTLDELQEKLRHASTETEKKAIQEQIDKITKYLSECNEQYIEDAEGIDYIQNPTNEDDRKVNEWLDYINDFQDKMAVAMGGENAKENAFNRLVDNWKFDELLNPLQKLGKEGKVTLDDLKSRMSDPVFAEFVNKLVEIGVISDTTDGSLRYLANAFNGTATSARNYVTALKGNDLDNFIKNLGEEAKALGTTESELAKLTAAHVIFNKTGLSTEQQQQALQMLAAKIATTSAEMKYLLQLFNYASGNFDAAGASTMTEQERRARTVRSKQYLKDKYGIDLSPIKIPEKEDVAPYTPSGGDDKGSSKDNTPGYEDPTDAIINRINLRAKELEQQEESIQNAIEIAELEKDYKKQISLTNDKLDVQRQKVDALKTANNELYQMAEDLRNSTPDWNEEEWFDSQGNATETYTNFINSRIDAGASKEEIEAIKDQFEKISKIKNAWVANDEEIVDLNKEILQTAEEINDQYSKLHNITIRDIEHARDMALESNPFIDTTSYYKQMQEEYHKEAERLRALDPEKYKEEIQELQKAWWDAQNSIVEWDWENSNRWIEERNAKGDWSLYGDSEYDAWQRVAKWLREKYPNELDKIHEADQNAIDARYQNSTDWIAERNTYNDWALFGDTEVDAWERVVKWLNKDYPNDINKIKEAEKSLFEARKKEFNDAVDFGNTYLESKKTLLQAHYDVMNSIRDAQHEINKELETSKTMYEYLDVDTRKLLFNQEDYNKLNEELNTIQYKTLKLKEDYERDLAGSTVETVEKITANYERQYQTLMKSYEIAKADLEIAKKKQQLNNALNERNVRMFINGSWQWVANTEDVANAKSELADAEYAKQVEEAGLTQQNSINELTKRQDELGVVIKKFEGGVIDLSDAVRLAREAIGSMPSALSSMYSNVGPSYGKSDSSRSGEKTTFTKDELADADITGLFKKKSEYASGTKYTKGGLSLMGEEDFETFISSNGHLIPINQPTIGNIESGGIVFNQAQMANLRSLWDLSNISGFSKNSVLQNCAPQTIEKTIDNRIIINGMTVDSGSSDGQALIHALRRYVGNH